MCDSSKQKTETCSIDESLISEQKRTFYFHRSPGLTFSLPSLPCSVSVYNISSQSFYSAVSFPSCLASSLPGSPSFALYQMSLLAFSVSPSVIYRFNFSFCLTLSVTPVFPCLQGLEHMQAILCPSLSARTV